MLALFRKPSGGSGDGLNKIKCLEKIREYTLLNTLSLVNPNPRCWSAHQTGQMSLSIGAPLVEPSNVEPVSFSLHGKKLFFKTAQFIGPAKLHV